MNIKQIIEESDTSAGRIFDFFIYSLIVLSLISFTVETLPDLSDNTKRIFDLLEIIVVTIFTVEYLLRFIVADKKLKFFFSFYGLIDLFAILPFYIARGIDLRSLRIFRFFRLIRAFKIFRYSKAIQRFKNAFSAVKEELILFLIATAFLLFKPVQYLNHK
jgi:voltage-gated potassium channel